MCVSKIASKFDTEFVQKLSHLLRRAKRGTRSAGFSTRALPRVLVGPICFFKSTRIFKNTRILLKNAIVPGLFSKCSIFSQKVQGKGKGEYYSKRKEGCKQTEKSKYHHFSQKIPRFFSTCSIFSQNVPFFSKCSIVF